MRPWLLCASLLPAATGCARDLGLELMRFSCTSDQECARGTSCDPLSHVCVLPGQGPGDAGLSDVLPDAADAEVDGGEADTGVPPPDGGRVIVALAAGRQHTCALDRSGTAFCWGDNGRGQLGRGELGGTSLSPAPVAELHDFVDIGAGQRHSCGLRANGDVHCWGSSQQGEAGGAKGHNLSAPGALPVFGGVDQLAVGQYQTTCALSAGSLDCVGFLIDGTGWSGEDRGPAGRYDLIGFHGALSGVAVGHQCMCALIDGGASVDCLGAGAVGPGGVAVDTPTTVPGLGPGVQAVSTSSGHTCVLIHGQVSCFGKRLAVLGMAGTDFIGTPRLEPLGASGLELHTGLNHACARLEDGTVKCWGDNQYGQSGGTISTGHGPGPVAGVSNALLFALGFDHGCALSEDGEVYCWGRNDSGALGRDTGGAADPVAAPVVW